MFINDAQQIAGIPAKSLRDAMQASFKVPYTLLHAQGLRENLGLDAVQTTSLLQRLQEENLLVPLATSGEQTACWKLTPEGRAAASATGGRAVPRGKADQVLNDLVQRVKDANASNAFLNRITAVKVFGNYLADGNTVQGLDVVVELAPKPELGALYREINRAVDASSAKEWNRAAKGALDQIVTDERELHLFLKAGVRELAIQLHERNRYRLVASKTVFRAKARG